MTSVVTAAGASVTIRGTVVEAAESILARLAGDGVPGALMAGNANLWGPEAAGTAARRLGWLDLPHGSRALLPELDRLAGGDADLDRVVLTGMGGASLAPGVIVGEAAAGNGHGRRELTVLDTTDPHRAAAVVGDRLERTLVVVASKSGATVETDSHRRIFEQAFRDAGMDDAELRRRFVVVTDPGSPLEAAARAAGYRLVLADPRVGGRYGALGAFGLVPSALAGADPLALLDAAAELSAALCHPYDNPGLMLGAALGASALARRDKLVIAGRGGGLAGFAGWAEQLVAGSTGKDGKGILPVVLEEVAAAGFEPAPDARRVIIGGRGDTGPDHDVGILVSGPLGARFLLWEYATAVAARVIGVNPFDQPSVQESKDSTAALLRGADQGSAPTVVGGAPALVDGAVEVHAPDGVRRGAKDLRGVLDRLLRTVPERGYLAVMAYLDPAGDAAAGRLRALLAGRAAAGARPPFPVTFGWGPRVLHSTGQFHKDGPRTGVFLQITGAVTADVAVPGRPYTLGALQLAQAYGDSRSLRARGRPVVRLHLRDRAAGVEQLLSALT